VSDLQQAIQQHQNGNLSEAESLYRGVLAETPDQADALALLGIVCGMTGRNDEAIACVEKATQIDPKAALFWFHLGTVRMNAKKLPEAIEAFRQAIALQPGFAPAYYNIANAQRALADWSGAMVSYQQAIQANPQYAEAYNNLALTLAHEKKFEEAQMQAAKSVEVAPTYGDGWLTLCNVAEANKNFELAAHAGEQNIKIQPNNHRAWFGYGVALNRLDRHNEAIAAYTRALELKPERADIWDNLGQTYQSLNRLDEAEATFRKTIEVAGQTIAGDGLREIEEKEYGNRHWHLALMELLRGKYKSGFARYRSRFEDVGGLKRPHFSRPVWKGESLQGKTILVCDEQGFGDTLMLARYLPLMRQQGARIIFSVHPVLESLFKNWQGADEVVVHGAVIAQYDYYASVFDLPHRFGTTLQSVPNNVPYLPKPRPGDAPILEDTAKQKVGVVWGGNPLHSNDSRRSVPLKRFAEIFSANDVQFYSLNRDMKAGDAEVLRHYPVIDLAPKLQVFADCARVIDQLDLVITVDTAMAHLAGGMGKMVWTLLPFAPDWRWLTAGTDSPWYPTMRLYRQPNVGDWKTVVHLVETDLQLKK
jgi:tetratricopeptide (TPR) repeat protein